jgi:hypothetical protein
VRSLAAGLSRRRPKVCLLHNSAYLESVQVEWLDSLHSIARRGSDSENLEFCAERPQWGRVGMWRGGSRPGMSVAAPFVWRCLKPSGQRRSNRNVAQLASSGKVAWNSVRDRALATQTSAALAVCEGARSHYVWSYLGQRNKPLSIRRL